jgi:hypothetical protein
LVLRDMEGQTAEEACELLKITAENQRVLLHRARSRVRQAIDAAIGEALPAAAAKPVAAARRTAPRRGLIERLMALAGLPVSIRSIWQC